MGSARFSQNQSELVAPDLIVGDAQHVTETKPTGIADQNPGWQQHAVRTSQRTPRHLRGYRKQVPQFLMRPRTDERRVGLDSAEGPTYTDVHYEAVAESGLAEGVQHSPVILHGGRSQPVKSVGQVSVDTLLGQVASQPRQALAQDEKLLSVAGGSPDASSVSAGKINQRDHFCYELGAALEGEEYLSGGTHLPPRKSATIPPSASRAPLAQLSRAGGWWGKATAALLPIISLFWWVLLASAIVLNASATAATLFLLGHLGGARSELRKARFPRRGS